MFNLPFIVDDEPIPPEPNPFDAFKQPPTSKTTTLNGSKEHSKAGSTSAKQDKTYTPKH